MLFRPDGSTLTPKAVVCSVPPSSSFGALPPPYHGVGFSVIDQALPACAGVRIRLYLLPVSGPIVQLRYCVADFTGARRRFDVAEPPDSSANLDQRISYFLQAKSNLASLLESFANAPSKDMSPPILGFLSRILEIQAKECVFMKLNAESNGDHPYVKLARFIGGAVTLSEKYGLLGLPPNSVDSGAWVRIKSVLPPAWLALLDIKSKYFQAQAYHQLASTLFDLVAGEGVVPLCNGGGGGTSYQFGDGDLNSLEGDKSSSLAPQLRELFQKLNDVVTLNKHTVDEKSSDKKQRRFAHRSHSVHVHDRSQSRLRRPFSRISMSSWGRSKSQPCGLNESGSTPSSAGRWFSRSSASNSVVDLASSSIASPGAVTNTADLPITPKDTFQLASACLNEAKGWMDQAVLVMLSDDNLRKQSELKILLTDYQNRLADELSLQRANDPAHNSEQSYSPDQSLESRPKPAQRQRRLFSRTRSTTSMPDTPAAPCPLPSSGNSLAEVKRNSANPWHAPTLRAGTAAANLELPKDTSKPLKGVVLKDTQDPFRQLGPVNYFNAKRRWTPTYTVHLGRDDLVGYGFSIQGAVPVEILGVDLDTPASDNNIMTGDVIVEINGIDARFMSHNAAVSAIRFGPATTGDLNADSANLTEVNSVDLTLVHPIAEPVQPPSPAVNCLSRVNSSVSEPAPQPAVRHKRVTKNLSVSSTPVSRRKASFLLFQPDEWFSSLSRLRRRSSTTAATATESAAASSVFHASFPKVPAPLS
ncbi:Rhophilin-2 [Sparganum proliferum]